MDTARTEAAPAVPVQRRRGILQEATAVYAIWLREIKRAIRDKGQLIGGVSRPLLWVIILGIGLNPYFRGEVYVLQLQARARILGTGFDDRARDVEYPVRG